MYPELKVQELEDFIQELDENKDGKVDIDEFISFMHSSPSILQQKKGSNEYKAVLAIKAQRRMLPINFMNYFEKISASVLYIPSYISELHARYKNLPSESFIIRRDPSGIGYADIKYIPDYEKRPTRFMQEVPSYFSGYIILRTATGIPIPNTANIKRENIVNRVIKIGFFDKKSSNFILGTTFVSADWEAEAEDVWIFNKEGALGTNPIVFKWSDKQNVTQVDVIFEFVSSIKYNYLQHNNLGKEIKYLNIQTVGQPCL